MALKMIIPLYIKPDLSVRKGGEALEDLKIITASNIIDLRTKAGMTQVELAEKLNYSDKSVSKWERGDAIPDAFVLKRISEIFGVSVDYLLSSHDAWEPASKEECGYRREVVTSIAVLGVWTLAFLIFIIFWLGGSCYWLAFAYAVPVSLVTLLVLNSIWGKRAHNYFIIAALIISVLAAIYLSFYRNNWWQLFLLAIPAELVVFLSSRIKKK